jgi:hypothetical protein
VLEEKERIADMVGFAGGDDLGLDAEAFGVRDPAELEEVDVHREVWSARNVHAEEKGHHARAHKPTNSEGDD